MSRASDSVPTRPAAAPPERRAERKQQNRTSSERESERERQRQIERWDFRFGRQKSVKWEREGWRQGKCV